MTGNANNQCIIGLFMIVMLSLHFRSPSYVAHLKTSFFLLHHDCFEILRASGKTPCSGFGNLPRIIAGLERERERERERSVRALFLRRVCTHD